MRNALVRMGINRENIVLSRVNNGPYPYDGAGNNNGPQQRNLTEICEEVDAGNFDMFFSIHSDAVTEGGTINRSLYLYRGTDAANSVAGSKAMAQAFWPRASVAANAIDYSSSVSTTIRGDISFYGSSDTRAGSNGNSYTGYLGVLKHGVPGFLSEGYCHTYQPARHRALNRDYCGQEGVRYARGVCDYFSLTPESTGYIMGAVKDKSQSISNSLYTYQSGTRAGDEYFPVMGAKVCLYRGEELIDVYTTDNNYNGIFVFNNIEPGTYTLKTVATGYADLTTNVTVTANETTYPLLYVTAGTGTNPADITDPKPANEPIASLELTNDGGNTYSDITAGVKSTAQHGDITVVLTTANTLFKIDNTSHSATPVSTTGIATDSYTQSPLNAIAFTRDGTLIGINKTTCKSPASGTVRVYKWPSLDSAPTLWLTTQSSAGYSQCDVGQTLTVAGDINNCVITTTATNSYPTRSYNSYRFLNLKVENGSLSKTSFANNNITGTSYFNTDNIGTSLDIQYSTCGDLRYFIDGESGKPFEFRMVDVIVTGQSNTTYNSAIVSQCNHSEVIDVVTHNAYFNYGDHIVMAMPCTTASGSNTGIKLFDITLGLANATLIATTSTSLPASGVGYTATHHSLETGGNHIIYLVKDNQVVKFILPQPGNVNENPPVEEITPRGIFAYALDLDDNGDDTYTFRFTPNVEPVSGNIVLYDANQAVVGRITLDNLHTGENEYTFNKSDLPGDLSTGEMTWGVELTGTPITSFAQLNTDNQSAWAFNRACATVDNSPESDYFGNIYASVWNAAPATGGINAGNGLVAYSPDWTRINTTVFNNFYNYASGNYSQIGLRNNRQITTDYVGRIYMSEYGDPAAGIYLIYPDRIGSNKRAYQFFTGSQASSGLWTASGANVGCSTSAISAGGEGNNLKLFSLLEDFEKNNVAVYNLVDATSGQLSMTWGKAPSAILNVKGSGTTNCGQLHADSKGGVWISHYNSTAAANSLIYANNSGTVVFNSSTLSASLNGTRGGGFAVSPDNRRLALGDRDGNILLYDITWNGSTPSLTLVNKFTDVTVKDTNSPTNNTQRQTNGLYQMAFDWGGNLVIGGNGIGIYSVPTANNTTITPAKKRLTVSHAPARVYTAANLRVCIDPGHGGYTSNDRNMATINHALGDTLGFYESNTNLEKAFGARTALLRMGLSAQNVVLTRYRNSSASGASDFDIPISDRRQLIEEGNFDMLVSIHSNASGDFDANGNFETLVENGVYGNFPLFLYAGKSGRPANKHSDEMAATIWRRHWLTTDIDPVSRPEITIDDPYIVGDVDYYDPWINNGATSGPEWRYSNTTGVSTYGYLGVLRHSVPGLLIEGFCHQYHPATQRALNHDYCRMMGIKIARGVMDFYNLAGENTGYIMGTVKDRSRSLEHNLYKYRPNTVDAYYPINGATVTLYKEGSIIATYTTDNEYNGIFAFNNLEPGTYKLVTSYAGYDNDEQMVEVTANETTYPLIYLDAATAPQGIFAYNLASNANSDGSYDFSFTANTTSTAASLIFYDSMTGAQVGAPVAINNVKKGIHNTITLSQSQIPGITGQRLNWSVSLTGKPITAMASLSTLNVGNAVRLAPTVDNSPESDHFGRIYASGFNASGSNDNGIFAFNQDFSQVNVVAYRGDLTFSNNYRVATDANGTIYLSDWGDATSGVYVANSDNLTGSFTQFLTGTRKTVNPNKGLITNDGNSVGGSTATINIANGKMYTSIEDIDGHENDVAVYDITDANGNIATSWSTSPSFIETSDKVTVVNGDYDIAGDNNGGIWVAQKSTSNTATTPTLLYYDSSGNLLYTSAGNSDINGSLNGAIAINAQNTLLAIHDASQTIKVFDIVWNSGSPTLSLRASLSSGIASSTSGNSSYYTTAGAVYQMAFDWGDNLVAGGEKLGLYAIPLDDNTHITPAKKALIVVKEGEPVEATLAQILGSENYPVGGTYSFADDYLTCVYVSHDRLTLYLKDHGNVSVEKHENDGQRIDYLYNVGLDATDQSNWVAVHLPEPVDFADQWENHRVTGITGTLTGKLNPEITAIATPVAGVSDVYDKNTYIVANFNPENWLHERYFFVNPKAMEIADINWAQWSASDNAFIVPPKDGTINQAGIEGVVAASSAMIYVDDEPVSLTPAQIYEDGKMYRFAALIKKNTAPSGAARRAMASPSFTLYPLAYSQNNILTGVGDTPEAHREVTTTHLFDLQGRQLRQAPEHGVYIEVNTYNDGTSESRKIKR